MSKSVVPIAANSPCSETITWTATQPGAAQVTAEATGLRSSAKNIIFPKFPWYFVWLAAGGGLLGAVIANSKQAFTRHWWSHAWRNLLVGGVLGAVCYVLVRYGALTLPKDSPVDIQKIPVVTALGSFAIGFVIGLWNRRFFKGDDGQAESHTTG
jgi:drug/metabolite transporter (DMT)-like permease